jgi:hypothetical protein
MVMVEELSRDPAVRLKVFVDAGLIARVPTVWQLIQGQLEMAPYVVLPDSGDQARYDGAKLGHPLLRTPIVFEEVGLDHLRVGHGMHAKPESLYRHLNFVFHEGMPVFDLQLVQTVPNGLAEFRRYTDEIERSATPLRRGQHQRIDWILPQASAYRRKFLEKDGWIDRAERLEYPTLEEVPSFLRPEFTTLVGFANYCARTFPESIRDVSLREWPVRFAHLFRQRWLDARYVKKKAS